LLFAVPDNEADDEDVVDCERTESKKFTGGEENLSFKAETSLLVDIFLTCLQEKKGTEVGRDFVF
jgi:hypothetical protein